MGGNEQPKIVLDIKYASASDVRAMSEHEKNRVPHGASDIDPTRSHLNEILHGPSTQNEALERFWAAGVKKPARQAEAPYVQIVLSASPEFFRDENQGRGQWNDHKMKEWKAKTMAWLKSEYGADLAQASLHLDEQTPHIHALVIPTYEKQGRRPGKPAKGETLDDFERRKEAAAARITRCAGRSSNAYWRVKWCRRNARHSYHHAVSGLGLSYGEDLVGAGRPSARGKSTQQWVREKAASVGQSEAVLDRRDLALTEREKKFSGQVENARQKFIERDEKLKAKEKFLSDAEMRLRLKNKEVEQEREKVFSLSAALESALESVKKMVSILLRMKPDIDKKLRQADAVQHDKVMDSMSGKIGNIEQLIAVSRAQKASRVAVENSDDEVGPEGP